MMRVSQAYSNRNRRGTSVSSIVATMHHLIGNVVTAGGQSGIIGVILDGVHYLNGIEQVQQRNTMKPIETEYKGYRFRSRLEARWAVFFDALNIKWEYVL